MKKLYFFIVFFSILSGTAQQNWFNDFNLAKTESKNSGKLMVIDFWADWCNPCKIMEKEIWNNPDVEIHFENFVAVKINVDKDRTTPEKFAVTGIPKLVVALPDGEIIWEKIGFRKGDDFTEVLNSIPNDVGELYKWYFDLNAYGKNSEFAFNIARQFQQLACNSTNSKIRDAFIELDEEYFKKAIKDNTDKKVTCDIDVYLLLNEVYKGNSEKALKKFTKKIGTANCENKELAHFFLANCYKALGETIKYNNELDFLESEDLIGQLN